MNNYSYYCIDKYSIKYGSRCVHGTYPDMCIYCNNCREPRRGVLRLESDCIINRNDAPKYEEPEITQFVPKDEDDTVTNDDNRSCVICMENTKCCLLNPCMHLCLCISCSRSQENDIKLGKFSCPVCRTSVKFINKIFL